MAIAEELQIIIDAKVTQAVRDLKKVTKGMDDTGKKSLKMGEIFRKLAGPLALGAVVLGAIRLGKEFAKAASDAEEIGSKYATIFRDISFDAEEVANTFAESFGLAGSTAKELLGNTADLLTGLGFTQQGALELSEQVNTLAVDLASFSNFAGGATGASEALTAALLGESERAKALGIVINQNTKEYKDAIKFYTVVEGKTLLQAKAFTALKFITEQSGNAIGDYARTMESTANVTKRLEEATKSFKEEVGATVNEGLTPLKSRLAEINELNAEYLRQLRELKDANKAVAEGTATIDDRLKILNDDLQSQVELLKIIEDSRIGTAAAAIPALEAQLKTQKALIGGIEQRIFAIVRLKESISAAERERQEAEAAEIAANNAQVVAVALLKKFFDKTREGQIQALELSIKEFETYQQTGTVLFVIRDLRIELNALLNEEDEIILKLHEDSTVMFGTVEGELIKQIDLVKDLTDTYKGFVSAGLSPLIQAFDNVGDAGANTWDVMKQAGKDAISGILKAFAEMWTVRAVEAAVALNFISAAGFASAAALAVAASSTVQNFATGTSGFIANQPTAIMVGEGAVSEKVTVEPVGGGGGESDTFRLITPAGDFLGFIQREGFDNGNLRVPKRNIV